MLGRRPLVFSRKMVRLAAATLFILTSLAIPAASVAGAGLTLEEAAHLALGEGPQVRDLQLSSTRATEGEKLADTAFHWRVGVGTARIPQIAELAQQFGQALGDAQKNIGLHVTTGAGGSGFPFVKSEPGSPGTTGLTNDPTAGARWAILPAISATRTLGSGGQLTLSTHFSAYGPLESGSSQAETATKWQPFDKVPLIQFTQPLGRPLSTLEPYMRKDEASRGVSRDAASASLAKTKTLLDVAQAYFVAAQARDEVLAAKRALESAQTESRVRNDKAAHNDATRPDLLDADLLVAKAGARLEAAKHAQTIADQRLNRVLGRPLSAGLDLAPPSLAPPSAEMKDVDLQAAIAQAAVSRQEMTLARKAVESARAQLEAAKQSERLQLAGSATLSRDGSWALGVDAQWPLFDAGLGEAQVTQAAATLALAEKAVDDRREEIALQVTQAYYGRLDAARAVEVADRAVARAREVADLTADRFARGATIQREVTATQDTLFEAEVARRAALYRWYQAEWSWLAALGQLDGTAVGAR